MKSSTTIRNAARLRDRGLCCNCGQHGDHTHHIVPLSVGGQDVLSNVVTICSDCHGLVHGRNFGDHKQLTRAGQAKAREQGKTIGRRPSITGPRAKLARRLHGEGQSLRKIARQLEASPSAVARLLKKGGEDA